MSISSQILSSCRHHSFVNVVSATTRPTLSVPTKLHPSSPWEREEEYRNSAERHLGLRPVKGRPLVDALHIPWEISHRWWKQASSL